MKNILLLLAAAFCLSTAAQAQAPAAETKALMLHINKLMRDPAKPKQEIRLDMNGCHATQTIRDNDASNVQTSAPISVSYNKGGEAGWSAKVADGKFEMTLDFEWREVESLSYFRKDDKDDAPYKVKIKRMRKGSSTNFELPLHTTDERVVRDVVARLEKVRQQCGGN
ncbi:hypothetical protein [Hymenobacter koreensis]|uniref:Uncharacterized protein n=1 Tax=Hymenobacter koreensis TaxID=1084523 RepID=A0ABP8JM05_9BACT